MKRRHFLGTIVPLLGAVPVRAQWEDLFEAGRRFLEENLDPALLDALPEVDQERVSQLLSELVEELQGEYVLDLAALEESARATLTLLDLHPETRDYAAWLRTRVDYFEVARWFLEQQQLPSAVPQEASGTGSQSQPPTQTETQPPPRPQPQVPSQAQSPTPSPKPQLPSPPLPIPTPGQQRQAWQTQLEKRLQPRGADVWVPRLKPVFEEAGLPGALVWLAEIESSFNPEARSPVGAAGLYQLMPATARELGLKIEPRDERLVPERNASAAATYLRRLHGQFQDWSLTLAAYNAGPGRVSRILRERRGSGFDSIAASLPAETQMYVPKFESVLRRREGIALEELQAPARA